MKLLLLPRACYQVLLLLCLVTVSVLALAEPRYQQMLTTSSGLAHGAAFFALALLCQLALNWRWYWQALVLAAYGGLIEIIQLSTPGRHASWHDFMVDLLALGSYYLLLWLPIARVRSQHVRLQAGAAPHQHRS